MSEDKQFNPKVADLLAGCVNAIAAALVMRNLLTDYKGINNEQVCARYIGLRDKQIAINAFKLDWSWMFK